MSNLGYLPESLIKLGKAICYKRKSTIIKKGDPAQYAYLLLHGELIVMNEFESGDYYSFAKLQAGSYIGGLEALAESESNAATVVAQQDSVVLRFRMQDFIKCLDEDIVFLKIIARGVATNMFRSSVEQGSNHYRRGIDKLVRFLLKNCEWTEQFDEDIVILRARHLIASEIGVNIRTLNRSVKTLKDAGYIRVEHGKIHVNKANYQSLLDFMSE